MSYLRSVNASGIIELVKIRSFTSFALQLLKLEIFAVECRENEDNHLIYYPEKMGYTIPINAGTIKLIEVTSYSRFSTIYFHNEMLSITR